MMQQSLLNGCDSILRQDYNKNIQSINFDSMLNLS